MRYPGDMAMPLKSGKQLVVNVPADLLAALEANAEDNGRTMAQTIRFLLSRHPALAGYLAASEPTSV